MIVDSHSMRRIERKLFQLSDEIAALAVRLARAYARTTTLFLVQGGTIAGFRGDSSDLERRIQESTDARLEKDEREALIGSTTDHRPGNGGQP